MSPWINYHHLFYFKTIAEKGSVTRASEKLRLGQPTLSAQLKQLEESMGVPLFDRSHKKLTLTEQGRVALDYARNIFKMGSEMFEVLHNRATPGKTTLHVGALDSVPKQIIVRLVRATLRHSPCQIVLVEGRSDELFRELVAHRLDLVLSNFLPLSPETKTIAARAVSKKNVAFFGAQKYKSLKRGFPQSISGVPLALPTYDSKLRFDLDHWAKLHKIELNVIIESQDIATKKLLAISGEGIVPTASHSVTAQVRSGDLVEIGTLSGVYEELYLLIGQRKVQHAIATHLFQNFSV